MIKLKISLNVNNLNHEVSHVSHLPRMDKFDRTVVALISVTTVILLLYVSTTNLYNRYLSHHYVAFNENDTAKFIKDWRQYSSKGYVLHIVLYDKSKTSQQYQSQIVSYMTKKSEDDIRYKPITVDMTNENNQSWVKDLNIKDFQGHTSYPISLTYTKDEKDETHIDVAKMNRDMSKSQVNMMLGRYK